MKNIAIIGWGNQAKAWAFNLRDSGLNVSIGIRENSHSIDHIDSLGFSHFIIGETLPHHTEDFVLLIPDHEHKNCLKNLKLQNGSRLYYAHGHSLTYDELHKDFLNLEHILLAPKSIATELRFLYETRGKISAVYDLSLAPKTSKNIVETLAMRLGITYLAKSSIKEETNADLFSEQTILCALLPFGAASAFKKLLEKGYSAEVAFMETWIEVKLIANTMINMGPKHFFDLISPNALIGAYKSKEIFFDSEFEKKLESIFQNIDSGNFVKESKDIDVNEVRLKLRNFWETHPLEQTFQRLKEKTI